MNAGHLGSGAGRRLLKLRPTFLVLCALGLAALGLSACGGDSDDSSTSAGATTTDATEEEGAITAEDDRGGEAEDDKAVAGGNAPRAVKVEIEDFAYKPDPVTVEEGGKVIWLNRDSAPHTATAEDGSFDTGTLEEGKLKSENFKQPGTYAYVCSIHPQMHGTVEVVPAG